MTGPAADLLADGDVEGFHFAVEVAAFEAEEFGGAADVVAGFFEFLVDEVAFVGVAGFLQGAELFGGAGAGALGKRGQVLALNAEDAGIEDEDAFDEIAEFADVAGPVVLGEGFEGFVADFNAGTAVLTAEDVEEFADEGRDVLLAFAQGGHGKGDDVEAVEEVFAEVAFEDFLFEVFVGGGDDADVDADGLGASDGGKELFVEGAEDLGLSFEAHVANFIEEEGAAVGAFESASLLRGDACGGGSWRALEGAGVGSVAVAEEFRLDVGLGDGGAVELDEDAVAAEAFGVDGAGDELFAGAGLAVDEDAAVGGGHEADLLAEGLGGDGFAGEAALDGELALEFEVVAAEAPGLGCVFEDDEGSVEGEGFLEEVVSAEFGGFDGGFDGAVAADDDDFGEVFRGEGVDVGEDVEAVAVREPDVEQDDVVGCVLEEGDGLGSGAGGGHGVSLFGEDFFE